MPEGGPKNRKFNAAEFADAVAFLLAGKVGENIADMTAENITFAIKTGVDEKEGLYINFEFQNETEAPLVLERMPSHRIDARTYRVYTSDVNPKNKAD